MLSDHEGVQRAWRDSNARPLVPKNSVLSSEPRVRRCDPKNAGITLYARSICPVTGRLSGRNCQIGHQSFMRVSTTSPGHQRRATCRHWCTFSFAYKGG